MRTAWKASAIRLRLTAEEKLKMLDKLNQAVIFENFLGTKFLGQKRFSLEGAEALIPALDSVIQKGCRTGHSGIYHRYGAPRPVECAGQYHGKNLQGDIL